MASISWIARRALRRLLASAAEIAGMWVAEVSGPMLLEPVYAHVTLESTGDTVTGTWGRNTVKGSHQKKDV